MVDKGTWVQIHRMVLPVGSRAANVPASTQNVPFEMWDKGWLDADAEMGNQVTVTTATGRTESGTLIAVNPSYRHDYGAFVPEIPEIDRIVKAALYGDER
ncbi:MAG: 2-amino-4-oxopentanoate thiolase subunit OrtA [bacterium]